MSSRKVPSDAKIPAAFLKTYLICYPIFKGRPWDSGQTFCHSDNSCRTSSTRTLSLSSLSASPSSHRPPLPSGAISRLNIFPKSVRDNPGNSWSRREATALASLYGRALAGGLQLFDRDSVPPTYGADE